MISINDFKVGDTVYMLDTSRKVHKISPVRVVSIGRKYVTVNWYSIKIKFYVGFNAFALIGKSSYSVNLFLFSTEQKYKDYIEFQELNRWLIDATRGFTNYTLDQLRKVREILEAKEVTNENHGR